MVDLTIWYVWLVFIFPFGIFVCANEWKSITLGIVGLLMTVGILYFASVNPLMWIMHNPLQFGGYVLGYFGIGALYALWKWKYSFLPKNRETTKYNFGKYKATLKPYYGYPEGVKEGDATKMVDLHAKTVEEQIADFKKSSYNTMAASKNKIQIMGWMVWWIPSLFWTITHDFFKAIWETIYEMASKLLERISDDHVDKTLK